MAKIAWGAPNERYYDHGLDRGVLFVPGKSPVPWNGLTGFEEGTEQGQATVFYRDGVIYYTEVEATDFSGRLQAMMFPREFSACAGIPEVVDGLFVDSQKPRPFSFAYRTLVGSGAEGDMFGYQIHLVYNATASIATRSRRTLTKETAPIIFEFDLVCTPVQLPGWRPTAHYVIDTRNLPFGRVRQIENALYGTATTAPYFPTPTQLNTFVTTIDPISGEITPLIRATI